MMTVKTLARAATLAGLLLGGGMAAPAFAGPADVALLQSFVGNWRGTGQLVSDTTETASCRLAVSGGRQDKVNFNGSCTLGGANVTIAGTVAYIPARNRYEAVMTSSAGFTGGAIGRKQGGGILFQLRDRSENEEGKAFKVQSDMFFHGGAIDVTLVIDFVESGDRITASASLGKS